MSSTGVNAGWRRTQQSAARAAASLVRSEVASELLRLAAAHVRAEVGVLYLWDEGERVLKRWRCMH